MPNAKCLLLVHRHCRINLSRPAVDPATQRLRFLEALLPQPCGYVHRAHAMMANDDDVLLGIEFLLEIAPECLPSESICCWQSSRPQTPKARARQAARRLLPLLAALSALPVRSRNPIQRSFPHPLRPPPLHKCCDAFLRVRGFHQLVEINLFGARQTFIEVNRVPRIECLLGQR